jgi:protein-disulfide isomerase
MAEATLTVPVGGDDHVQGPADAPVTLVEYGDFECPHCGEAHEIVKEAQARFGDRMRFVYRHFPLTQIHHHAQAAAEASEAAAAQGKFWEMHDTLFENQEDLSEPALQNYAAEIGLDEEQFAADLENETYREKVEADFLSGAESGVNGTPTFFINGVRFDGNWRSEDFFEALQGGQTRIAGR